ncbi:uncharacterized protein RCH25_035970 [Pelodytes ibericus]
MSRKRRKNKSRKSSVSDDYEQVPFVCRCQKVFRKPCNNQTDADLKENSKPICQKWISETEQEIDDEIQSHNSLREMQAKLSKCEENSKEQEHEDELEDVTATSTLNEPENIVKITLTDNPTSPLRNSNEPHHNQDEQTQNTEKITAHIISDCLQLNVEIKNGSASNSRTKVLITNKKPFKKSRSYHDTHHLLSQHTANSSWDFSSFRTGKDKVRSTAKKQTSERSLIKLEIIGEGIEVKYKTVNQNLMVRIEADQACTQNEDEFGSCYTHNTNYPSTEWSCNSYPVSEFSGCERKEFCANFVSPEWHVDVPPPEEFADGREEFLSTITDNEALLFKDSVKESYDTQSMGSCCWGMESNPKQAVEEVCKTGNTAELGESSSIQNVSNCVQRSHKTVKPKKKNVHQAPFISDQEFKLSPSDYIDKKNNDCPFDYKMIRRKTLPEMYYDQFITFNHLRQPCFDSEDQSLPCKVFPDISAYSNSTVDEKQSYFPASELSTSLTNGVSFPNEVTYHIPVKPYNETGISHATEAESVSDDDPSIDNHQDVNATYDVMKSDISSQYPQHYLDTVENRVDEDEDFEDLMKHADEHTEFTESGFDEEMLDSDNHTNCTEPRNKCFLVQVTPPSRSTSREYVLEKCNSRGTLTEEGRLPAKEISQSGSTDIEITTSKRRGSVVTVVTGDSEQRLLIQGDNQALSDVIDTRAQRELQNKSNQHYIIRKDSVLTPVTDVEELDLEANHSSYEDQNPLAYKDISSQTSETFDPFLSIENQCTDDDTSIKANDSICPELEESNDILEKFQLEDISPRNSSDSAMPSTSFESTTCQVPCLVKSYSEENHRKNSVNKVEFYDKPGSPRKKTCKRDPRSEMVSKHLKLPMDLILKETRTCESPQEEASDRWAKKRKQFKETKTCNSAGGSSIASNITEESGNSEETRSADLGLRTDNNKDKGLYTESFHSASWIFRGDDSSTENSPRCLSKRPRSVAIRERTVRISKGTGDYPWGFRIQFSKPILVTEVDTNGAAEEAGLQVGDIVMAVNGTDVTSIPHSEAATLARQEKSCSYRTVLAVLTKRVSPFYGPKIGNIHQFFTFDINHGLDVLTLVVGSDISRFPNTPRPTCRGYLHKRTHSGLFKGWRKRWFVLKHDGSLLYYKHKNDEGKTRSLEVTKLEGSEIGVDTTLGKPFVFRCVPPSGNRIYYFCATSNQEMKRWLEAMDKAIHPLNQNHVWVDVTMHNISLPPLAIKNPECLGLLQQLDRSKDVWVQHYCILKDGCLYFYSSIRSTSALGGIYLQGYTVTEQSVNSKRCIIELKPPSEEFQSFYLSAGIAAENKRWITALKISINKWLPLHQAIQDFMSRPPEETRM